MTTQRDQSDAIERREPLLGLDDFPDCAYIDARQVGLHVSWVDGAENENAPGQPEIRVGFHHPEGGKDIEIWMDEPTYRRLLAALKEVER